MELEPQIKQNIYDALNSQPKFAVFMMIDEWSNLFSEEFNRIYSTSSFEWSNHQIAENEFQIEFYEQLRMYTSKQSKFTKHSVHELYNQAEDTYNIVKSRLAGTWDSAEQNVRDRIVKDYLVPHYTVLAFFSKELAKFDELKYFQHKRHQGHEPIFRFFYQHGFGTIMPVLTYLSVLSSDDRCVILEHLFDPSNLDSVLSDKLLLAYVTNDRKDLAQKVLENAERNGENELNLMGLRHKLNLGLAPKRNRSERLKIFNDFLNKPHEDSREIEFLHLMIDFCNEHYE